jgi:hypothetical protein
MPLPPPAVARTEHHVRRIECRGFRRDDGLWDIEGRIVDTKTQGYHSRFVGEVKPGHVLHDMSVRMTVDENLVVRDIVAVTDVAPYRICPEAASAMDCLKGLRIASGWTAEVRNRLGGAVGCTHIVELMGPVATTAYQTLVEIRLSGPDKTDASGRPLKIDSCYAYGSDRELVRERWPRFFTGG